MLNRPADVHHSEASSLQTKHHLSNDDNSRSITVYDTLLLNNNVPFCHYVPKTPNSDANVHSRQLVCLNTVNQCRLQQITYRRQ